MKDEGKKKKLTNAVIANVSNETVQRYGAAAKEHLVAYSGVNNELSDSDKYLKKSLKSISEQGGDNSYANIKQKAGFSAEVKDVANTNAENIIKGDKTRKIRSDDAGSVNDELYDHFLLDESGNKIVGSGTQMKFVGSTPKEALDKLTSKKFSKYYENDVKIEVPSDFYEDIIKEADKSIENLREQIKNQSAKGNAEQVKRLQERLDKLEKVKKNLKKSTVSNKQAMFLTKHPRVATAIDVAKVSHRAGVEAAKGGVVVGGSISIIKNIVDYAKGEKEAEDAFIDAAKDAGNAALVGYGTGFAGAAIKGSMQNAGSSYVRALSKTNLPANVVAITLSTAKVMKKYFDGDIDGVECLEELGQTSVEMMSAAMFGALGTAVAGGIGMVVGPMLGYAIASASYSILVDSLKEAKLAHQERLRIEQECEEHIRLIKEYRVQLEDYFKEYLTSNIDMFHEAFGDMKNALNIGDVDGFISEANRITTSLGKEVQFNNMDEFDELMSSDISFKL